MKIIDRIYQYIDSKRIKAVPFEKEVGLSNGYLGKQLKRNADLGESVILKIIDNCPDLNPLWLLTGKGEMLKDDSEKKTTTKSTTFLEETKNTKKVVLLNESKHDYSVLPKVVTVDNYGRDNVVLVPNKAAAGYLAGYGDPTYIEKLPTYNLPNLNNGSYRMFQVAGDSMEPTIQNQSYVVGEWKENWKVDIKDGRVYVFVIQSEDYEGILVKRALNRIEKYGNLLLKSDNRIYASKVFLPEDIKEVWEVKVYLSFNIPDPSTMYDRLNDQEARLINLENLLLKLNPQK